MMSTKFTVDQIVHSDPETMGDEPVYIGTRIPVVTIADMLAAGDTIERIREGYSALSAEQIALAPEWVKTYGRPPPPPPPWWREYPLISTRTVKLKPRTRKD